MRIDLLNANDRVIDPDQLAFHVPLEHAHLPFVGRSNTEERSEEDGEKPRVRDNEPGLAFFPGKADQGRTQDIRGEKREQDCEVRAAIDVLLRRRRSIPGFEEGRISQGRSQAAERKHRQLDRSQEVIDPVDGAR
jgi:hypothetical protein